MSTKTTFKRIALVAVASLGMGLISSLPAKAAYLVAPTVSTATGSATKAKADSTTAASIAIAATSNTATTDTLSVNAVAVSYPTTEVPRLLLYFSDTTGSTGAVASPAGKSGGGTGALAFPITGTDSIPATIATHGAVITSPATAGTIKMNLLAQLDTSQPRAVGTYTFTVFVTPYAASNTTADKSGTAVSATLTITVAALASESATPTSGTSVAYMTASSSGTISADENLSVLATSSTSVRGYIYVNLLNTGGAQARESVTITTTIGNIGPNGGGSASAIGKNVTLKYDGTGAHFYPIFADGTAGTATITIKTASVTFSNKSIVFYAATPATLVASALNTVPGITTTSAAVQVVPKDSAGNLWGGSMAIYSDTLGTISDTGTACVSYLTTLGVYICPVTGLVAGTAKVTVRDATLGVVSNAVSLTVSGGTAATVKLAWDKASYAPGEKATLSVTVLDSTGNAVPANTFTNLFATGGITLSVAAGNGSDTVTAVSVTTSSPAAGYTGTSTIPQKTYTIYMPPTGGDIKATATGGTALPLAGQVAVSATATVADSGSAALAAVTALASQVSAFITKINAQITTLTDLVMKIQKKVKA